MNSMLLIIPVAAGAFIATNLDNLALLMAFLIQYRRRRSSVAVAYLVGASILGLAGYVAGHAGGLVPVEYIGWLGLVPVLLGIWGIINLFREDSSDGGIPAAHNGGRHAAFLATLTAQLGNGADTIITFGALFADSNPASDLLVVFTLIVMAIFFLITALYAIQHRAIEAAIAKYAERITPFILIIVGTYILADTATDLI